MANAKSSKVPLHRKILKTIRDLKLFRGTVRTENTELRQRALPWPGRTVDEVKQAVKMKTSLLLVLFVLLSVDGQRVAIRRREYPFPPLPANYWPPSTKGGRHYC
ncbi:hypothetical protein CEXT_200641 [Caerostris extrusa]|uniref:Uncharacterized protein n=1 Tax=Caerostris extrusa TaxID=172846 RepID=A0AAV4XFE5_CAEEX|nr:hypothetical protein CEXT_200641 [Caerostris extrusa]